MPPAVVGDLLAGVRRIELDGPTTCAIDSGQVTCSPPLVATGPNVGQPSSSLSGVVAGNTLALDVRAMIDDRYTEKRTGRSIYRGHYQVVLEPDGRALYKQSYTVTWSANCSKPTTNSHNYDFVATWRVLE